MNKNKTGLLLLKKEGKKNMHIRARMGKSKNKT